MLVNHTPKLQRSGLKRQRLWASGELSWPDQPASYNDFSSKLRHYSGQVSPKDVLTPRRLKAESQLRKLPIVDSPQMVIEVADLIESRLSIRNAERRNQSRSKKHSTAQWKYRFEQGDRIKAIELQQWLDLQMEAVEQQERTLPELIELKQQVVQIMLNEAISWVQTICNEWAQCFRTGLAVICTLISKAFVEIHQKRKAEEKKSIGQCIDTHNQYADLVDKLRGEVQTMRVEKEATDSFSNNLIYNMRMRNRECKHIEKNLRVLTHKHKRLKEELARLGFSIVETAEDSLKSTQKLGGPKSHRTNGKISAKSIRSELSIIPHIVVTSKDTKHCPQPIRGPDLLHHNHTASSQNRQVKFNLPDQKQCQSPKHVSRAHQHHRRSPERQEDAVDGASQQRKRSLRLTRYSKHTDHQTETYLGHDNHISQLESSKYASVHDDVLFDKDASGTKDHIVGSLSVWDAQNGPSKISLISNRKLDDQCRSSGSLVRLKMQYLERRKELGSNHFPIEMPSLDSIIQSDASSVNEQESQSCLVAIQPTSMDNEAQTDLSLMYADFGLGGFQGRCPSRHRTINDKRPQRGMWMNAATQTRAYCAYNSGVVSVKLLAGGLSDVYDPRRSINLQRFYRQSILETIKQGNVISVNKSSYKPGNALSQESEESSNSSSENKKGRTDSHKVNHIKESMEEQEGAKNRTYSRGSQQSSTSQLNRNTKRIERERFASRTFNRGSASRLEELSKRLERAKRQGSLKNGYRSSDSTFRESQVQLRSPGQYQEDRSKVRGEDRKGRRNANINVLKPRPFHKPSVDIAKMSSNNLAVTKKAHHTMMDSGDVIDSAISRMLRTERSSGKENLLPCELIEKAKETTKFLSAGIQHSDTLSHHSSQSGQMIYPQHILKQIRSMYLHGYKELVRGRSKLLLTNIIVNYFGIIYGNLKNVSAKDKMNKFFRKVSECQHKQPALEIFCMLTGVGTYQGHQELLCVHDLPMYLKLFFTLNCASQDNSYTTLLKLKIHLFQIMEEFVGAEMANQLTDEIKSLIRSKLAYNNSMKQGSAKNDDQHIQINLQMMCQFILDKVFKARKSFQQDFRRVFKVLDECNQTPSVSVEFFEFLNRCTSESKIRYVSRIRTFLRQCEMLHKNRKCMSKQKFTLFAMKNSFPRFSQIGKNLNKSLRRRTTLKHIRDFIGSENCNEQWKKEKTYLWEELTRSDKLTSTEGILIEFITNMIEKASTEQAEFLQTLYEMIYYEVFDSQAQRLLILTMGSDMSDLYVQSIMLVKEPE